MNSQTNKCCFNLEREYPFKNLDHGCQFVDVKVHYEWQGRYYCRYHLPMEAKEAFLSGTEPTWQTVKINSFNEEIIDFIKRKNFNDILDLSGVVFPGDVDFGSIMRFPQASFQGCVFNGFAWFRAAASDASPSTQLPSDQVGQYTFSRVIFIDAVFNAEVSFNDRVFTKPSSFRGATFHVAPTFYNCKLYGDTDFVGTKFLDTSRIVHSSRAYRRLKMIMEEMGDRIGHEKFHALELKAITRLKETTIQVRLLTYLYEIFSNYGQSFLRPLIWLAGASSITFLYYGQYLGVSSKNAAKLTMEQIIKPFSVWSTEVAEKDPFKSVLAQSNDWVLVVPTIHSLFSLTMLALFLFAVRRRFKM